MSYTELIFPRLCVLALFVSVSLFGCGGSSGSDNSTNTDTEGNTDVGSPTGPVAEVIANTPQLLPVSIEFENQEILEASGVQRSLSLPGAYYVHNDSGSSATLYVTDALGQSLGQLHLSGAQAIDWEAIAGARLSGEPHIVVADLGNNNRSRSDLHLEVIAEPNFNDLALNFDLSVEAQQVGVSYSDGLDYDAEAVLIDGDNDTVVVITINGTDTAAQSVWRGSLASGLSDGVMVLEYRGLLAVPASFVTNSATDIDIHPNGRSLALLVYGTTTRGKVLLWQPAVGEGTIDALLRPADQEVLVPVIGSNGQAEGISFSSDGDTLLVAAEGSATSTLTLLSYLR